LPQALTHLTFGGSFDKKLDNLPKTLTHLTLNCYFNEEKNILPENLIFLSIIYCDNIKKIPHNVKILSINQENKIINNLPNSIEKIYIDIKKKTFIENLPYSIKEIVVDKDYYKEYIKKIPLDAVITIGNKEYLYNLEYKNN
jgi:hypothetical protein